MNMEPQKRHSKKNLMLRPLPKKDMALNTPSHLLETLFKGLLSANSRNARYVLKVVFGAYERARMGE